MRYNDQGEELPDPQPVEVPLRIRRQLSHQEQIMAAVRTVMSQQAAQRGLETWEEANDFDVADDEPVSPYELTEMQEEAFARDRSRYVQELRKQARERRKAPAQDPGGPAGAVPQGGAGAPAGEGEPGAPGARPGGSHEPVK